MAKSIFDLFSTDKDSEKNGIWINYEGYGRIKIARAGGANDRYMTVLEKVTRPHRRQIESGIMNVSQVDQLLKEVYAKAVVLDWDIKDQEGNAIPYSVQKCIELFDKLPDLYEDIKDHATRMNLFRAALIEGDSKN